ncbi:MAG: dienelactone hydrolase family protein [Spirochaetota bacterium]
MFKLLIICISCFGILLTFNDSASAKIITKDIEYKEGDTVLQGYLAYDNSIKGKRPGILIIHEWNGLGSYVKMRSEQIVKLGYVAFCADIYGKGIRPKNMEESGKQAGIYRADRELMRKRAAAGLAELRKQPMVDSARIAAMGYCFGGQCVLELARSGADISGAASFHGNLDTPFPEDAKNIKAKILVMHGANDPYVTRDQMNAFQDEMRKADNVDWQLIIYSGAVHGFTNPANGNDSAKGLAYNKNADKRSWDAMKQFYKEIFILK